MAWKNALGLAPALVDSGRKLWERVASRRSPSPVADPAALEQRIGQIESEATASFEVVRAITQQHSQLADQQGELVQAVDALLARTQMLLWVCGGLALGLVALLAFVIAR